MRYGKTIKASMDFYKMVKLLKVGQTIALLQGGETIILERKEIKKTNIKIIHDELIDFDSSLYDEIEKRNWVGGCDWSSNQKNIIGE